MFIVVDCWSRTIDRSLLIRVLIVTDIRSNMVWGRYGGQSRLDLQDTFLGLNGLTMVRSDL